VEFDFSTAAPAAGSASNGKYAIRFADAIVLGSVFPALGSGSLFLHDAVIITADSIIMNNAPLILKNFFIIKLI
jgi:hypothetical protein